MLIFHFDFHSISMLISLPSFHADFPLPFRSLYNKKKKKKYTPSAIKAIKIKIKN